MTFAGVVRVVLGLVVIICAFVGWFGAAIYSGFWWDELRIDFPSYGSDHRIFVALVFSNWCLPAIFVVFTLISILGDCCKQGNIVSSFFSGIGIFMMLIGLITLPILAAKSKPENCEFLMSTKGNMTEEISAKLTEYLDAKTKGMDEEKKQQYIENFDKLRCEVANKNIWIFLGLQIASLGVTFILVPFYTCP